MAALSWADPIRARSRLDCQVCVIPITSLSRQCQLTTAYRFSHPAPLHCFRILPSCELIGLVATTLSLSWVPGVQDRLGYCPWGVSVWESHGNDFDCDVPSLFSCPALCQRSNTVALTTPPPTSMVPTHQPSPDHCLPPRQATRLVEDPGPALRPARLPPRCARPERGGKAPDEVAEVISYEQRLWCAKFHVRPAIDSRTRHNHHVEFIDAQGTPPPTASSENQPS